MRLTLRIRSRSRASPPRNIRLPKQAKIETIKALVDQQTITAPIAFQVYQIPVEEGEVVVPGIPLISLVDLSDHLVRLFAARGFDRGANLERSASSSVSRKIAPTSPNAAPRWARGQAALANRQIGPFVRGKFRRSALRVLPKALSRCRSGEIRT
jgi:hypothetical protein